MFIKLYTAPYCTYSLIVKRFLEKQGVAYEEVNVTADEAGYWEMVEKSHQSGVPVIEMGNHIFVGASKEFTELVKTRISSRAL